MKTTIQILSTSEISELLDIVKDLRQTVSLEDQEMCELQNDPHYACSTLTEYKTFVRGRHAAGLYNDPDVLDQQVRRLKACAKIKQKLNDTIADEASRMESLLEELNELLA